MEIVVRIDRRAEVLADLQTELRSLVESVSGLVATFIDSDEIESARDGGKFRDFVDVARLEHEDASVLEWVAEELIDEFGWLVDIVK